MKSLQLMLHDKAVRKGRKQRYISKHTLIRTQNKEEIFTTITVLVSVMGYVVVAGICNYFLPPQLVVMVLQMVELPKPSFLGGLSH